MIGFYVFVTVVQVLTLSGVTNAQSERLNVTVYYETLCPFAKKFIVEQLHPLLHSDLSPYIELELIPYGKAKTEKKNDTHFEFTCHHKAAECYGNKIQACALVLIDLGAKTENLGFNRETVDFIACLMKDLTQNSTIDEIKIATEKCSPSKKDTILSCADDKLGSQYLDHLGKLTDHFQNPLRNVPTIVLDGVFRKKESDLSEKDFRTVFCSKPKTKVLTECHKVLETVENTTDSAIQPIPNLSLGLATLLSIGLRFLYRH
ncbi:gamma-interferon-inducible lysosomal thiol reductase-like protein isoform X1 [Leptinotarsa decemlineata]|uniref:gamma-interferon-inducible lysosomal thiol reductase-like protein isoform X1 n=1 Tax=Leptinotarsa decemlineata TaxID=7539 RepID=UPI003D308C9D